MTIIHVPLDYTTISAAISNASPGDVIQVGAGIYDESIVIDKSIILLGNRAGNNGNPQPPGPPGESIIQGNYSCLIQISQPNVIIKGFTIRSNEGADYGIRVTGNIGGIQIIDNYIENCYDGIRILGEFPMNNSVYIVGNIFSEVDNSLMVHNLNNIEMPKYELYAISNCFTHLEEIELYGLKAIFQNNTFSRDCTFKVRNPGTGFVDATYNSWDEGGPVYNDYGPIYGDDESASAHIIDHRSPPSMTYMPWIAGLLPCVILKRVLTFTITLSQTLVPDYINIELYDANQNLLTTYRTKKQDKTYKGAFVYSGNNPTSIRMIATINPFLPVTGTATLKEANRAWTGALAKMPVVGMFGSLTEI